MGVVAIKLSGHFQREDRLLKEPPKKGGLRGVFNRHWERSSHTVKVTGSRLVILYFIWLIEERDEVEDDTSWSSVISLFRLPIDISISDVV